MKYAKIIVKSNYEKRGDLVLRSYVRAMKKIKEDRFLDGENAIIYGVLDDNNNFYELFTNTIIDYDNYYIVGVEEIFDTFFVPNNRKELLTQIIENVLFGKGNELNFEISTIEELAKDRAVEFDAYDKFLSRINPYQRLTEENADSFNDYNNFLRKIEEVKKINQIDKNKQEEYDEYEVLENPRKLIKK